MKSRSLVIGTLLLSLLALAGAPADSIAKTILTYSDTPQSHRPTSPSAIDPGDIMDQTGDPDDILGGDGNRLPVPPPVKEQDPETGSLSMKAAPDLWFTSFFNWVKALHWRF